MTKRRGFTLLEMLVATVIMAVAVSGLMSSLSPSLRPGQLGFQSADRAGVEVPGGTDPADRDEEQREPQDRVEDLTGSEILTKHVGTSSRERFSPGRILHWAGVGLIARSG